MAFRPYAEGDHLQSVAGQSAPRDGLVRSSMSARERLQALRALPIFANLAPDDLVPLASVAEDVEFPAGAAVVRQGEPGDSVYLITAGRVQVSAEVERDGIKTEVVISLLGPGETVGELSLLDGQPRSASCIAMSPTRCLKLERDPFLGALERHWSLSRALLAVLAGRLRRADARLAEQARDPLTGLYSRASLTDLYEREVSRAQRAAVAAGTRRSLAVLYTDVDRFKEINDRFGHHTGDEVLRATAATLMAQTRKSDIVARLGGDEFVALLADSDERGTAHVAARIRATLHKRPPGPVPFSLSIGTTIVDPEDAPSLEQALAAADEAMYRDKSRIARPA
jgi:diguanylate cyclase (GGDEF)-like protein